jgi:hypothetical protein
MAFGGVTVIIRSSDEIDGQGTLSGYRAFQARFRDFDSLIIAKLCRHKLAPAVTQMIEDLLRTKLEPIDVRIVLNNKVPLRHIHKLARRLEDFGTISPAPLYT